MKVATTGDIHCPRFLTLFESALDELDEVDLFLLAGDLVLKNSFREIPNVISAIREVYGGQIIACFGNEEYQQSKENYLGHSDVTWLDDASTTVSVRGRRMTIVGTRGSLDRPTYWQRTYVKGIWSAYRNRIKTVGDLITESTGDIVVVISHYAPTYETMVGERETSWPEMGTGRFERVIQDTKPSLWLHAHVHRSKRLSTRIGQTLVVNVSLPARKKIVVLEPFRRGGSFDFHECSPRSQEDAS